MQEEEKNAVTPTEAAETPEQPGAQLAEEPAEGSETADAAETAAEDTAEISETAPEEVPAEPEDKIRAIRTSLFHIAQEEEEEAVTQRVAQQIQQVKDQKEHPEKYPPPPMPPKPRKQTFGQKMLGAVSTAWRFRRRSGAEKYLSFFSDGVSGLHGADRPVLCGHFPCG